MRTFLSDVRWTWTWWRFKRRRRALEAWLCAKGDVGHWDQVRQENDLLGVWRRWP